MMKEELDMKELPIDSKNPVSERIPPTAIKKNDEYVKTSSSLLKNNDHFIVEDVPEPLSRFSKWRLRIRWNLLGLSMLIILYLIFFIAIILIQSKREKENYWCDGDGLLILITCIGFLGFIYFKVFKFYIIDKPEKVFSSASLLLFSNSREKYNSLLKHSVVNTVLNLVPIIAITTFLIVDGIRTEPVKLRSGVGIFAILCIGVLFSKEPKQIKIHQVVRGLILQVVFGILIVRWSVGKSVFECLGGKVTIFLGFVTSGSEFAFGKTISGFSSYAFTILPMIIFFSMLVSVLFYYGILPWMIVKLGWVLEKTMGTTPCESMAVAANIFLGQSESVLVIHPYISQLTKSELHAVLTGGHATIAGTILAAYIAFGVDGAHLLSASVMSAPAAIVMSKIFYPETEISKTKSNTIKLTKGTERNLLHALMTGLSMSLPLIANILACLIGFIALNEFLNAIVDWCCQLLDYDAGTCNIQHGLAYPLMPLTWLIGIPWEDCNSVANLLATKFLITDFVAYKDLTDLYKAGLVTTRSMLISTYALCGFSSIASMGCMVGVFTCLAPSRVNDIVQIGFRAVIAGNFACYLTACVAGLLTDSSIDGSVPFNSTVAL